MAALYSAAAIDPFDSSEAQAIRCFMQNQLGYLTNHRCSSGDGKCNTGTSEGFSYLIGCGLSLLQHTPTCTLATWCSVVQPTHF